MTVESTPLASCTCSLQPVGQWGSEERPRTGTGRAQRSTLYPTPHLDSLLDRKRELRESTFRRSLAELAPQLTPLWPPALVFLIEARCGPDALGGSWGGRQGRLEGSIPGLLLPPHCIAPQSQAQAPSWRPVELPTLFPDLLAKAPPAPTPPLLNACLYSSTTWSPLASSHTSSTSASSQTTSVGC